MARPRSNRVRRWTLAVAAVVLVAVVAGVLFQPWKLFTNTTVDEANPITAPLPSPPSAPGTGPPSAAGSAPAATQAPGATPAPEPTPAGQFSSLAHATTGTATVGHTAGGDPVVFLENLSTDNGPDLKVYLSTVPADGDASRFAAEGLVLGDLKGNRGNQSYAIPAGTDLAKYRTVVIWCERFSVGFGVAPIAT